MSRINIGVQRPERPLFPQNRCLIMNCLPSNPRPFPIRIVLIHVVMVSIMATSTHLAAQAPDIATLRKQAKDGDAEAQYLLSNALLSGDGVPKDSKQGVDWLLKAASQDHPGAQLALAKLYLDGRERNIRKDPKQGLELMRKSADHGWAGAEYNLGLLYLDGNGEAGILRNPHEAASWLRKAARQPGSTKSQSALEEMLRKRLISEQEANWRPPFSLVEVETGLKGWITNNRMATLVQKFGVDFKLSAVTQKRLKDEGANDNLLQTISTSKRLL